MITSNTGKKDKSENEDSDDENVVEVKLNDKEERQTEPEQIMIEEEGKEGQEEPIEQVQNENTQMKENIVIEID